MFRINDNFCKVGQDYLFSKVARKIEQYKTDHPGADIIKMSIGDVTRPLCPAVVDAMVKACEEQRDASTFRGYGPEQGYSFLTEKIALHDYNMRGLDIAPEEIFVSDGAKSDTGNIGDILSSANRVALTDPVYPVYLDTNIMGGRAGSKDAHGKWSNIEFLPCTADNGFVPALPAVHADMIYLCYPNNPTGTTLTRDQLAVWVEYARRNGSLILFDSAYEAYITEPDVPHSIYEIEGAREVAIEFRSFSKTAGFTGVRCGYTVVPKELVGVDAEGNKVNLNRLWNRRQCTKFNGASYISQRAAEAVYSDEGHAQIRANIEYYLRNASVLRQGILAAGLEAYGGINAPYIWVKTPANMGSWEFFDYLLDRCKVACTPGVGFGSAGEGYVRLTAFNSLENTQEAARRIATLLG